jgi:hypothetical protein
VRSTPSRRVLVGTEWARNARLTEFALRQLWPLGVALDAVSLRRTAEDDLAAHVARPEQTLGVTGCSSGSTSWTCGCRRPALTSASA